MTNGIAIVTGATGGLGSAIAARLAQDYEAVLLTDLDEERLSTAADRLRSTATARVFAHPCDVSEPTQVEATVKAAAAEAPLTGLVNAAGIGIFTDFFELTPERWDDTFAVNTKGTFLMSQEFARHATPPAAIVNISSIGARMGSDMLAHYGASKAAVIELSHSIARGLAGKGIRSNTIMPGVILTDMWRTTIAFLKTRDPSLADVPEEQVFQGFVDEMIPLGRPQEPEDIAEAAAFFLSDRAKNITGQTLAVDGGAVLT